jgi:hypothetical protein
VKDVPELVPGRDVGSGFFKGSGIPGLALKERTLHSLPAEVLPGEVDDDPAEVGPEGFGVPQVLPPGERADERILDQVLGQGAIPDQEVRQSARVEGVPFVELGHLSRADLGHRCPHGHRTSSRDLLITEKRPLPFG